MSNASLPWTLEVEDADGTWRQLGEKTSKAWRYKTQENAERDITSKHGRRFFRGVKARAALLAE